VDVCPCSPCWRFVIVFQTWFFNDDEGRKDGSYGLDGRKEGRKDKNGLTVARGLQGVCSRGSVLFESDSNNDDSV
jgi:hypothetical protein